MSTNVQSSRRDPLNATKSAISHGTFYNKATRAIIGPKVHISTVNRKKLPAWIIKLLLFEDSTKVVLSPVTDRSISQLYRSLIIFANRLNLKGFAEIALDTVNEGRK